MSNDQCWSIIIQLRKCLLTSPHVCHLHLMNLLLSMKTDDKRSILDGHASRRKETSIREFPLTFSLWNAAINSFAGYRQQCFKRTPITFDPVLVKNNCCLFSRHSSRRRWETIASAPFSFHIGALLVMQKKERHREKSLCSPIVQKSVNRSKWYWRREGEGLLFLTMLSNRDIFHVSARWDRERESARANWLCWQKRENFRLSLSLLRW